MASTSSKRRIGDRKEGRQLRSISPFCKLIPYITNGRNGAGGLFSDSIEVSEAERYLRQKRVEGYSDMSFMHLFISAYVHAVAMRPGINRFVGGQRIFSRDGIHLVLAAKRSLSTEASETLIKIALDPSDTLFEVYRKVNEKLDAVRADESESAAERLAGTLVKAPGAIIRLAALLFGLFDYFDWLPRALIEASPFHGSMLLTDMSMLGTPPIYRHPYSLGSIPVSMTLGAGRRAYELGGDGHFAERRYVDYRAVLDGRICDGHYYSSAVKYLAYYLENPQLLELPPDKAEQDVF